MNLSQLHSKFGTQEKCIRYLEKIRWSKRPICVHCSSDNVTKRKNSIKWHCNSCNKGRVYVKIIEKLTGRNLLAMLKERVKTSDSIVITDGFRSYNSFDNAVEHLTIKHSEGHGKGIKTVNTIEGFWSIMKNGIRGSYRSLSKKYLPFYLAEYSYKFNNRHLQKNSFEKLIENTVKGEQCMINYKPKCEPKVIAYGKTKCKN